MPPRTATTSEYLTALMKEFSLPLRFLSPCFLGDAQQVGAWRTPPFKAALRQWWRVARRMQPGIAAGVDALRDEEARLFGTAADADGSRQSQVRLRLDGVTNGKDLAWSAGKQKGVAPLPTSIANGYAWFGLVNRGRGVDDRSAIEASLQAAQRQLRIACPSAHAAVIQRSLQLIHAFGTLGSRSRGGWGSLHFEGIEPLMTEDLKPLSMPLGDCLRDNWPAALGRDDTGLMIWESQSVFPGWDKAMAFGAEQRREVRTSLKNLKGRDLRAALGFAGRDRSPSPLRWKLVASAGGLRLRVFALPHRLARQPDKQDKEVPVNAYMNIWSAVAGALDASPVFKRGYSVHASTGEFKA